MRLEEFAGTVVLRPCPAADHVRSRRRLAAAGRETRVTFCRQRAAWINTELVPQDWRISHPHVGTFSLKPTPLGQVGVFCEQAENWDWIARLPFSLRGLNALNLFAYTGGTTMALARKGANVVHLDSARNVVNWARRNAELSGLTQLPIRWINEDALKFIRREIKRGKHYDVIVADPPAIGHGGKRMTWKLTRDIELLFELLGQLQAECFQAVLVSAHSEGLAGNDLRELAEAYLKTGFNGQAESGPLDLSVADGRSLNFGYFYRWHGQR